MSRGTRHGIKRLFHSNASMLQQILFVIIALGLLAMVIFLPPASSPLRSRVHHYRREELRLMRGENRHYEALTPDISDEICLEGKCDNNNNAFIGGISDVELPVTYPGINNGMDKELELTLFIVFHRRLYEKLYDGLIWSSLLPSHINNNINSPAHTNKEDNGGKSSTTTRIKSTQDIISQLHIYHQSGGKRNGNRIFFLATKEPLERLYNKQMIEGRILREWEMPGFTSRTSFLQMYSAILTVYHSEIVGKGKQNIETRIENSGEGLEEWVGFLEYDMRIDQKLIRRIRQRIIQHNSKNTKCCIFYGASYNTIFLLNNTIGRALLIEYNKLFKTEFTLHDLPPVSATGAFVVPTSVFHRVASFLENIAHVLSIERTHRHNTDITSENKKTIISTTSETIGKEKKIMTFIENIKKNNINVGSPIEIMEAALALSLGLETSFVHVEVPIRHMTGRELEDLEEIQMDI